MWTFADPRTRCAAALAALLSFVPLTLGCGGGGYYAPPPQTPADGPGTIYAAQSVWSDSGMGWSEPSRRVLAQADRVADDEYWDDEMDGVPRTEGEYPGDATDARDAAGDAGEGGEPTWEEMALPEVARPAERLVIKNGLLRIELDPPEDGPPKVVEIARRFGGYVAVSSETSITIRVPSDAFEEVLEAIAALGEVAERIVRGDDVTEEYYDLNVRLRNSLAVRLRYLALLDRAESVEEALLVERELERVTLEIERLRGRLRYLRDRIQDATIEVYFLEEYEPPEEASPGPIGWIFYGLYLGVKWLFVWDEPGPGM